MPRPSAGPQLKRDKRRGGVWYITWSEQTGGRTRTRLRSTGTSDRAEAHRVFAEWIERGAAEQSIEWTGPRRAAEAGIADVLAVYAQEHSGQTASPETIGYAIKALLPWWGERTCDYITPQTCRAYVRARQEKGVAAATAGRELTVLRAALGHAHKNGRLIDRPFVELPSRPPGRDRWLTRSEAARLLWESRRDEQARGHLPAFIMLALRTGARPSALFDLQWNQIDFARDRIDFNPPGRAQTSKRRPVVPIPRRLRWFLLRWHARATSRYVLAFRGQKLGSVKRAFRRARARAGLEPDVIPYTLRHTCGTWLAQGGVDLWVIAGWLGHTQARTTELYAHHAPGFLKAARKVMD